MNFRIRQTRFRIDWLMLLFPCLSFFLGDGARVVLLLLSLTAHEAAHLLAAYALRVPIHSIRLSPFGGMAQMQNPYAIAPVRLILTALAGPCANLLLLLTAASLCHWGILPPWPAGELIRINTALMLFNLLPALPLDGGRALYAALSLFLPRERAATMGILAGRALAALLTLFALWGVVIYGRLNLSPLFAALFILASAEDEKRALSDSRLRLLLDGMRPIGKPVPAKVMAVAADTDILTALQSARPGRLTLFAVYRNGRLSQIVDDRQLIARLVNGDSGGEPISQEQE